MPRLLAKVVDDNGAVHDEQGRFTSVSARREPKTDAERTLHQYLKDLAAAYERHASSSEHAADLQRLLDEGQFFEPRVRPAELKRGLDNLCFQNAFRHMSADEDAHHYVEGYAHQGYLPVHHAWTADAEGNVNETTWRTREEDEDPLTLGNLAYFGIKMDPTDVRRTVLKHKTYGTLFKAPLKRQIRKLADLVPIPPVTCDGDDGETREALATVAREPYRLPYEGATLTIEPPDEESSLVGDGVIRWLFEGTIYHGTNEKAAESILRDGLDPYRIVWHKKYGPGTYFATDPAYVIPYSARVAEGGDHAVTLRSELAGFPVLSYTADSTPRLARHAKGLHDRAEAALKAAYGYEPSVVNVEALENAIHDEDFRRLGVRGARFFSRAGETVSTTEKVPVDIVKARHAVVKALHRHVAGIRWVRPRRMAKDLAGS